MVRRAILEELDFNIILFRNWECSVLYCFSIQLHYTTLHYTTLNRSALHYTMLYSCALHFVHSTTPQYMVVHCIALLLHWTPSNPNPSDALQWTNTALYFTWWVGWSQSPVFTCFLSLAILSCVRPPLCTVRWITVQCSKCSAVQCSTVRCSAVQFSAMQCSAVQCSAVQCSAV